MQITEYIPTDLLKPYVKVFKIIESCDGIINRVLPNTSFALSFNIKGQISYLTNTEKTALSFATFSGLQRSARQIKYDTDSSGIIVLFRETGASAFFKNALHELYAQSLSLDHILSTNEISILRERILEKRSGHEKIAVVEQFLLSKLDPYNTDIIVSAAISKITASNGNLRIKELSKELYISQDAFEKRFKKITGTTPKQFSCIVKMNAVISQYHPASSFLDIAIENGYYDQPHFNKDFKLFTGQTPSDFFQSTLFW